MNASHTETETSRSTMSTTPIVIYSDGSSRGNPGPGGFGAVMIYPDASGVLKIDEYGGNESVTTNNRMELLGVITALESLIGYYGKDDSKHTVSIYTDSGYVINGIESWIQGWKRNNWITKTKEPVKNVDLWQRLSDAVDELKTSGFKISWIQVPGHAGVPGNERCDVIATAYADAVNDVAAEPNLYKGFTETYEDKEVLKIISKDEIAHLKKQKDEGAGTKKSSSKNKNTPAYSYVSYVNGQIATDATWAACEARVKGQSKAKFKKSISQGDEQKIISEFLAA